MRQGIGSGGERERGEEVEEERDLAGKRTTNPCLQVIFENTENILRG